MRLTKTGGGNTMNTNVKKGVGIAQPKRRKTIRFRDIVRAARVRNLSSIGNASSVALRKAKRFVSTLDKMPHSPRILHLPKTGGFLPLLVPLMAGLSAVGSLAGGASAVAKAINEARDAKARLEEMKRHNLKLEEQKIGSGLYIKPYKQGYGIYKKGV